MDEAFIRAEKVHDLATLPTAYRLVPKDDDTIGAKHQGDLLLSKGSCLLYQLHQEMGDEAFASFLQNYLSLASFQPATTSQIPVILKQITGKDYAPFFEQYYWGTALPTRKQ